MCKVTYKNNSITYQPLNYKNILKNKSLASVLHKKAPSIKNEAILKF